MQLEIYRQILEKSLNVKFHNIRPVEAEMFYADRQDEANSRFTQLRKRLSKHSGNNTGYFSSI